jgi:Zn-dependent protease with chaperone function
LGYLLHIIVALAALGIAESGYALDFEAPLGVLLLCAAPYVLQLGARRLLLRGRFRSGERLHRLLIGSAPLSYLAAMLVFDWNATVERLVGTRPAILDWPHPVALLSLGPFALYTVLSIDARVRLAGVVGHHGARGFHVRLFAVGLVPIVGWILFAWAVGSSEVLRVHIEEVALFGALFAGALFALVVVLLPFVVRYGWETRPLPAGPRRALLEGVARSVGFRCREILLWGTAHQMANAAVIGINARHRVVLLSDALLAQLPDRELVAVFAHEIAHVVRRHVLVFLAAAMGLFFAADIVASLVNPESELLAGALVLAVFAVWYAAFGWLSRRFELEADLWSLEVTRDPDAMAAALERVGSPHGRRSTWRHFGTEERVAFLRRAAMDPTVGAGLHRFVRRVAWGAAALALVGLAGEGWMLSRGYGMERVYADLRLGAYERAGGRLEALGDAAEVFERRVRLARALPPPVDGPALVQAARTALARGDEETARDFAELARLRGADVSALEEPGPDEAALRTGNR